MTVSASFGHNQGGENTDTDEARVCHSDDGGKTWSAVTTIDAGDEPGIGASHGVFHSHQGRLWPFTALTPARCRTSTPVIFRSNT